MDFSDWPLAGNAALFAACSIVVWIAGARIARLADRFAVVSGIGHAMAGLLLLAGITSLPEVAVSLTAAAASSPQLALNNLLGSIAMQVAILALADAMLGKDALTVVAGTSVVLLQVTMNVLLLVLLALAIGDRPFLGAGAWTWGLAAAYALAIWTLSHAQDRQLWVAKRNLGHAIARPQAAPREDGPAERHGKAGLGVRLALAGAVILVAGFLLTRSGEALAQQTGLGSSFAGAVLIAVSTSLPEVSSVVAAVKLHRCEMAISDVFGTNLFNLALVFLVDVVYPAGPVVNEGGRFALVACLLATLLACIYLVGLLERRNHTVARMGLDSATVLVAYLAGVAVLYQLR